MPTTTKATPKVADEVWIATALLHRENTRRADFMVSEIVARAAKEGLTGTLRPGVYVYVVQHCVANRPANPARYRILTETAKNTRRLFRPGDPYSPDREGAKTVPDKDDIAAKYHPLLDWYQSEYVPQGHKTEKSDPLLALRGSGKQLWADEHADSYIRRLREGWE